MLFLLPGIPFPMPTTAWKACKTQFQCHLFWDAFLMAQAVATSLLRVHSPTSMTAYHTLSPTRWKAPKGSVIFNSNDVTVAGGNGEFMFHWGKNSTNSMKFNKLEVRNNIFKGVKNERELLQNVTNVKKRVVNTNTYSKN